MSETEECDKKIHIRENKVHDPRQKRIETALLYIQCKFHAWQDDELRRVKAEIEQSVRIDAIRPELDWKSQFYSELHDGGDVRVVSVDFATTLGENQKRLRYTLWLGRSCPSSVSIEPLPEVAVGQYKRRIPLIESQFKETSIYSNKHYDRAKIGPTIFRQLQDADLWPFSDHISSRVFMNERSALDCVFMALRLYMQKATEAYSSIFAAHIYGPLEENKELYRLCDSDSIDLERAWREFNRQVTGDDSRLYDD